ncbi:MAG: hypothetical protein ACXVBY_14080, partial [Isosphaeraceae bacterium]
GTATPGATITYTNNQNSAVTTAPAPADPMGNYTITVPLADGPNTFTVRSSDGFTIQSPTVTRM